jgi:hypothetical protein
MSVRKFYRLCFVLICTGSDFLGAIISVRHATKKSNQQGGGGGGMLPRGRGGMNLAALNYVARFFLCGPYA